MRGGLCVSLLIYLSLQPGASTSTLGRGTGWFDETCNSTTIHIDRVDGRCKGSELVLQLARYGPLSLYTTGKDWWSVQGSRCSHVNVCEQATRARIWLDAEQGKLKQLSGKYELDFGTEHLEGEFVVKFPRHKRPVNCE